MKKFFAALYFLAMLQFASCNSAVSKDSNSSATQEPQLSSQEIPLGNWGGVLDLGICKLTLIFDVKQDGDGKCSALVSCVEQDLYDLPAIATKQGDGLQFEIKTLSAVYQGMLNESKTEIHGSFSQRGTSFPLVLTKDVQAPVLVRTQEPKAPYPYREEEIHYDNQEASVILAGTLTLPEGDGPFPAALLIAGSGPTDRDESIFGHKPFWVIADHLTRQGIAVLRTDKRGVGASTGDYEAATSKDFASDVLAGIAYLKSRNDIDSKHIGLIGHSEGGLVAPMAASQTEDVAFLILLAGLGVTGEELLYEQAALIDRDMGLDEVAIAHHFDLQKKVFTLIKKTKDLEAMQKQLHEMLSEEVQALNENQDDGYATYIAEEVKIYTSPWFRYILTCDPAAILKQIQAPILALNGELDLQVSPRQNIPAIKLALQEGGNPDYTVMELPKLNHLFQTCKTGSVREYAEIEETIAPIMLDTMTDWILKRV